MHPSTTYILFCALARFAQGVSATAYVPFLREIQLSVSDVGLLEGAFSISMFLSELPTGMLADGKSRAWSLRVGTIVWMLSVLAYSAAIGFWTALLCEIGIGIGCAFLSGAQQAWVVDALKQRNEGGMVNLVFSRAAVWSQVAYLMGGFVGALSFGVHLRLQWIIAAFALGGTYILARYWMRGQGEPKKRSSEWQAFRQSVMVLREKPSLRWVVASVMLFSLVLPLQLLWAPFFQDRAGTTGLSFVWMYSCAGLMLGGYLVRSKRLVVGRESSAIVAALMLCGVSMALMGITGPWAPFLLVFLWRFGNGLHQPSVDVYVHERIESSYRATFGSLQSFLGRSSNTIVLICMWAVSLGRPFVGSTIGRIWLLSGCALIVGTALLFLLRRREAVLARLPDEMS